MLPLNTLCSQAHWNKFHVTTSWLFLRILYLNTENVISCSIQSYFQLILHIPRLQRFEILLIYKPCSSCSRCLQQQLVFNATQTGFITVSSRWSSLSINQLYKYNSIVYSCHFDHDNHVNGEVLEYFLWVKKNRHYNYIQVFYSLPERNLTINTMQVRACAVEAAFSRHCAPCCRTSCLLKADGCLLSVFVSCRRIFSCGVKILLTQSILHL